MEFAWCSCKLSGAAAVDFGDWQSLFPSIAGPRTRAAGSPKLLNGRDGAPTDPRTQQRLKCRLNRARASSRAHQDTCYNLPLPFATLDPPRSRAQTSTFILFADRSILRKTIGDAGNSCRLCNNSFLAGHRTSCDRIRVRPRDQPLGSRSSRLPRWVNGDPSLVRQQISSRPAIAR